MVNCTFAGHREVYGSGVEERLNLALERLLEEDEEVCFYAGGMGEFDAMSARAVRVLRQHHPEKKIHLYPEHERRWHPVHCGCVSVLEILKLSRLSHLRTCYLKGTMVKSNYTGCLVPIVH